VLSSEERKKKEAFNLVLLAQIKTVDISAVLILWGLHVFDNVSSFRDQH
jgi:hypothetical protein